MYSALLEYRSRAHLSSLNTSNIRQTLHGHMDVQAEPVSHNLTDIVIDCLYYTCIALHRAELLTA